MNSRDRRIELIAALALGLLALLIPFQGIQWGDGLEFVAVASHLGVAHPPGYPLFILMARAALLLPTPEPYAAVLLGCRIALWCASVLTAMTVQRLLGRGEFVPAAWLGAGLMLFSPLMADSLHCIEVYTLQALLVAGVAYATLHIDGSRVAPLALAGSCLGLALANHLPGLSLAPLLVLAVMRHWRRGGRAVPAALATVVPMVLIPLCLYGTLPLRVPAEDGWGIAWGRPDSLAALLTHVRGGEYGQYQLLQAAPGVPMTFSVWLSFAGMRLLQTIQAVADLLPVGGRIPVVAAPLLLALGGYGAWTIWKDQRAWLIGIAIAVAGQLAFISVYNIPDIRDYFVPLAVLVVPMMLVGLVRLVRVPQAPTALCAAALILALGLSYFQHEPSRDLAEDYRERLLTALPEGCALLTSGDADVYTMWYEQQALGKRTDVAVVGANFIRFPWFRQTIPPSDPRRTAVEFVSGPPPRSLDTFIDQLADAQVRPLLAHGRIFWSTSIPQEAASMRRHFEVRPAFLLLNNDELLLIRNAGLVNFPAPILYEIESR
ncbi:DUF2723 domain-containing protein [bacterium]|nr:DUF2723 domain-containing protein [bacterium]